MGLFVVAFSSINLYLYFNQGEYSYSSLSGLLVAEISKTPQGMNISLIAFLIQWFLLVLIVIVAYVRMLKHRHHEDVKINYQKLKGKNSGKSGTDLDILYALLKEKKKLKISVIAKTFSITNDRALEWAKILENYELGAIEYPAFDSPELRIKESEEEKKEIKKPEENKIEKEDKEKKVKKEKKKIFFWKRKKEVKHEKQKKKRKRR